MNDPKGVTLCVMEFGDEWYCFMCDKITFIKEFSKVIKNCCHIPKN